MSLLVALVTARDYLQAMHQLGKEHAFVIWRHITCEGGMYHSMTSYGQIDEDGQLRNLGAVAEEGWGNVKAKAYVSWQVVKGKAAERVGAHNVRGIYLQVILSVICITLMVETYLHRKVIYLLLSKRHPLAFVRHSKQNAAAETHNFSGVGNVEKDAKSIFSDGSSVFIVMKEPAPRYKCS